MNCTYSSCLSKALIGLAWGWLSLAASAQSVTNFTLVNTDTRQDMVTFSGSATVTLSSTPHINLRANTAGASKVTFTQGGTSRTESAAPFAFKGDSAGVYVAWSPAPAVYTITATPYASNGTAGPAKTVTLTVVPGTVIPPVTYNYQLVLGHDGYADPDDNLAALAGFIAARSADLASSRVTLDSMIYGDTLGARKQGMIAGGPATIYGKDAQAEANYKFFTQYTRPAVQSIVANFPFYDVVVQTFNFNATTLGSMSSGGTRIAELVRNAIGGTTRVVYSAGGGTNAGAEAIGYLRNQGHSDTQIKNHFAIVEHSNWNWSNATESTARTITTGFVIAISDQNVDAGRGSAPTTVMASKTSSVFANAWSAATGVVASGIANLSPTTDASDGGSHSFASNASLLDTNWDTRHEPVTGQTRISYRGFTTAVMNALMN